MDPRVPAKADALSFTCNKPGRRIALVTELPTLGELGRRAQAVGRVARHGRTSMEASEVFIRKRWLGASHSRLVRGRLAEIYAEEFMLSQKNLWVSSGSGSLPSE